MIQKTSLPKNCTPRSLRGVVKRDVVIFAAFGLAVLAMALPAALVSKMRMAAISKVMPKDAPSAETLSPVQAQADEIKRLKRELLRAEDQRLRLLAEIDKLRSFKNIQSRVGIELNRFLQAQVTSYSVNWQERTFLINKGLRHGVHQRAGVLAGNAVAGVVVEVGMDVSRVAMIGEEGAKIAAITLTSRRSGLAIGKNHGCDLCFVPKWADNATRPSVTEPVMTSGRLGFFPKGFVLGNIASVGELSESLHLNIAIKPEITEPPSGQVWVFRPQTKE